MKNNIIYKIKILSPKDSVKLIYFTSVLAWTQFLKFFCTSDHYGIRVMFSNKKSSFMAGILIQAPFITKKWMYIIKNGQRPRGLEQEGLKGQKFLAG